jgi:ComF family protein
MPVKEPPNKLPLHSVCARAAGAVWHSARDFVFPPLCIVCDMPLDGGDPWLCGGCAEKLAANARARDACPRCGQNRAIHECTCELAWDNPFDRVASLFDFDDTVRAIIHRVKYRGMKSLAFHVASRFAGFIPGGFFDGADAFCAIPLHPLRKLRRGYNQAEFIARGFAEGRGGRAPVLSGVLKRVKRTKTQTKLDREQREKNLAGAFAVAGDGQAAIAGKNLVLVDDVVTTGATTKQCTLVLLAAGAASVRVLSLARD